eukprot:TRINITY_DN4608_c0_g1_i1.p1 TRINITY_DN4608_c0_g1~~TRINITY_DN4608_c0_g1_i1.p1  ORF type:complete len:437 (-),score=45.91 TRINITY_DN4608_c0_g1_i1:321-1631(-)
MTSASCLAGFFGVLLFFVLLVHCDLVKNNESCRGVVQGSVLANVDIDRQFCAVLLNRNDIKMPRTLRTASNGDIYVLDSQSHKVVVLQDINKNGKIERGEAKTVFQGGKRLALNHGLALDEIHKKLYVSDKGSVYRLIWNVNKATATDPQEIVKSIPTCCMHITRSLALDDKYLYVQCGSGSNVDSDSSHSQIRRFRLGNSRVVFAWQDGELYADGMRNEVAMRFDNYGRLWGAQNGMDNLNRPDLGGDIHEENPAEEVHMFEKGQFYGYPYCWTEFDLPKSYAKGVGTKWMIPGSARSDEWCRNTTNVRPVAWSIRAHSAPMGMAFYNGEQWGDDWKDDAIIALHGSWNAREPRGYSLVRLDFPQSKDRSLPTNPTAMHELIRSNNKRYRFRPVSVDFGSCYIYSATQPTECLYVSLDSTNEIVAIALKPSLAQE